MRDEKLDIYRGIAIIYVIFIHALYWPLYFTEPIDLVIKSLFLIEMPIFFFITGATLMVGRDKTYKKFVFDKFKRILIPYWIFALICLLFTTKNIFTNSLSYNFDIVFSWVLPLGDQVSTFKYSMRALWFIPIYLLAILFVPFIKKYYLKYKAHILKYLPIVFLSCLVLFLQFFPLLFDKNNLIQTTIFYLIWIYLGLFYFQIKDNKLNLKKLIPIFSMLIMIIILKFGFKYSLDMQINKFPPNIMFLVYTLFALMIIWLFREKIVKFIKYICKCKTINWIFKQYKDYCYTAFLYQPFAFYMTDNITKILCLNRFFNDLGMVIIYFILSVIINAFITSQFGKFENMGIKKVK